MTANESLHKNKEMCIPIRDAHGPDRPMAGPKFCGPRAQLAKNRPRDFQERRKCLLGKAKISVKISKDFPGAWPQPPLFLFYF